MNNGMDLVALAQRLQQERSDKRDFVGDTRMMQVVPSDNSSMAVAIGGNDQPFALTQHARRQLEQSAGLPAAFADRAIGLDPAFYARTMNDLLTLDPKTRMLRTLGPRCRAVLSDRYRTLDNYDLAEAVLPVIERTGARIVSCSVTDTKLYIKAVVESVTEEIMPEGAEWGKGHDRVHILKPGIVISNSEIGMGSLAIQPSVYEVACTNLLIRSEQAMKKLHVGRKHDSDGDLWRVLSDETRRVNDAAVWMQVRDVVRAAIETRQLFDESVALARAAANRKIEGPVTEVVQAFAEVTNTQLTESEKGGILEHLIRKGEYTQYGLQYAVTEFAGRVEDYDRATELEQLGGRIIELPANDWKRVAERVMKLAA